MKFNVILADPPWFYQPRNNYKKVPGTSWFGGGAAEKYPLMTDEELLGMAPQIKAVAEDNCAFFLWYTFPRQPFAHGFLKACGFRFSTVAFVWTKISKVGQPIAGPGYFTGSNCEPVMLGVKGSMPPIQKLVPSALLHPRLKPHSKKPEEIQDRIERMYPEAKKLELFATRERQGWTCLGNGIDGRDIKESLGGLQK